MSSATLALRPGGKLGPALGRAPWPIAPVVLSAALHVVLGAAVLLTAAFWPSANTTRKTYVVNLVPSIAALGSPQGQPSLPPRAPEPERPARSTPTELPQREAARATPIPDMPARTRDSASLPDRQLPARPSTPALPRAGDKERPPVADAARPAPPAPANTVVRRDTSAPAPPPPAPPLGQATGSLQGAGPVTVSVSDFAHAWYLAQIQRKIGQNWQGRAMPGRQPVAVFEIARDGTVSGLDIEKSSGNSYYDRAALRAISDATPFPKLPDDFPGSVLRIHLGFNFTGERG